jgi:hypothetical protein
MHRGFNLHGLDKVSETIMVVNPAHRVLDGELRKNVGLLNCKTAEFGPLISMATLSPRQSRAYAQKKSNLQEVITRLKKEVDELRPQRKATQQHIAYV